MTSGQMLLWQGPRPRPHSRGEDKLSKPKSQRSGRRWRQQSRWRRNLIWLPPPQHRRQQPPAHQHRTSERRPPQSAPAGPHSRPRRKNENRTVLEHEYRPRDVRRVVRPPGAAGHSRPDGGRNAAPWPGSSSSPSPAWLEDASSAGLEDGFHRQMPEEEVGRQPTRRQAPARLALLPSKDDPYPGLLLPTIELVVTILGDHW
jgi:hypothetical protein